MKEILSILSSIKVYSVEILLSICAIFLPIKGILVTVGVLIFADMATGIWAASKRKEEITSAAWRRTITKMAAYNIAILSGYLLEVYLLTDLIPAAKLVAGVIGLVEFKSLLENTTEITGVNFKTIIKKLGSDNDSK